ncbi:alpha/beta hydrolase family protein [Paenibacillus alkalitolerans]|uniref:alpha/beta hydrolase family protein n=1 Tax=Paenibacillus alkalitolerans TaxID=2799335 RepID=UPI0018F5D758|nr:alpha/beta fold hydrolase [Paenibacillus alkalitolerans]
MKATNENGVIISQVEVERSLGEYAEQAVAYRIEYLSDGYKVVGFIIKQREINGKTPLLIYNRGGAEERGLINHNVLIFLSYFVRKGFVVLTTQYRGNDGGEGQDRWGGDDINDVLNLMRVAEKLDYVDMSKKVMLGQSRGGLMTYLALKKKAELNAAVVINGPSNMIDLYYQREEVMKEILDRLVGDPVRDKKEYTERSAIYWAEEINVPVLIIHGEKDLMVPVSQAREMIKKLEEYKKKYRYLELSGTGHFVKDRWEELRKEIIEFFNDYIT